jgi:hypothetical protein
MSLDLPVTLRGPNVGNRSPEGCEPSFNEGHDDTNHAKKPCDPDELIFLFSLSEEGHVTSF